MFNLTTAHRLFLCPNLLWLMSQVEFAEEVFPNEIPVTSFFSPSGIGERLYTTVRVFVTWGVLPSREIGLLLSVGLRVLSLPRLPTMLL